MSEIQLNIALEKNHNPLRKALADGKFIFLAECRIPEDERTIEGAASRIMPLAEKMWSFDDLYGGLAVLDLPGAPFSPADLASEFPAEYRNRNLFYLSGSGKDINDVQRELTVAAANSIENLAAVSGDAWGDNVKMCRARNYTGSVRMLEAMKDAGSFWYGATVNPFQYRAETMLGTLGNMRRKLLAGAEFIVTQSGWDMLQNQNLSWYMLRNSIYIPQIVRLTFLSPEKIEKIIAGKVPGLSICKEFRQQLDQELCGSSAQFEAAQYRRLELQAAGARLMGASGIQLSGVNYPGKAEIIARRIRSALEEFKDFNHWLDEYNRYQAEAEMGTSVRTFRLYDRILRRDYPFDEPPAGKDTGAFPLSRREKINRKLCKVFFSKADRQRAGRDRLLKKLLASCRGCDNCRLPQHSFVCVENCPKRLEHGPCGGVREDGKCEIGNFECVHVKIVRFSSHDKPGKDLEL